MMSSRKPILTRIREFNLLCATFGHVFGKPTPFLNTANTGVCGHKKACTRCSHVVKEYEDPKTNTFEYPRLS